MPAYSRIGEWACHDHGTLSGQRAMNWGWNSVAEACYCRRVDRYECDQCGDCCQGSLIVEADDLDVLREPRIIDADPHHRGTSVEQMVHDIQSEWKAVILACGRPCAFLTEEKRCGIYATRPSCCVGLQAGDEQCQTARKAERIPPLEPDTPA